ncbi:MAG: metallophosphoesterase [Flavobacterium sp.]|nr:MAG: metallophosphoesterase [Flavobacterium sp.]
MIAVISDIHGNYEALKVVLAELDRKAVSKIYCLGDVVGYYSQVNECCDVLREREIECLMGNHDWYMSSGSFCPRSQSVNDCLVYQRKVITAENIEWLKTFQIQFEVENIKMVHGGWTDPIDEYLYEPQKEYFDKIEGEIFISGHTHIQGLYYFDKKTYCNPGSVGMPRDNDPRSAYATVENGKIELHRVEYDMEKVFDLMHKAGFNDYYYGGLKTGARNLKKL